MQQSGRAEPAGPATPVSTSSAGRGILSEPPPTPATLRKLTHPAAVLLLGIMFGLGYKACDLLFVTDFNLTGPEICRYDTGDLAHLCDLADWRVGPAAGLSQARSITACYRTAQLDGTDARFCFPQSAAEWRQSGWQPELLPVAMPRPCRRRRRPSFR